MGRENITKGGEMRKLDLNIDLSNVPDKAKGGKTDVEIAVINLGNTMAAGLGRAKMGVHRLFYRIMNQIQKETKENKGIVILDDSDLNFMRSCFNKAELPVDRLLNEILVRVSERIDKTEKVETPK